MKPLVVLKKVSQEFVDEAVDRACYLLQELASGEVLQDRVSSGDLGCVVTPIDITAEKVNKTIGFNLSNDEIQSIFRQLASKQH